MVGPHYYLYRRDEAMRMDSHDQAVALGWLARRGGVTQSWKIGYDLAQNAGAPVVFLNSQLSERYSLGGPLDDVEEVYYLKPISKGFVYRAYPGGWQCILDKPDGTQEKLQEYAAGERPTLGELSQLTRSVSQEKFGAAMNDKFTNDPRMGGRMYD